MAKSSKKAGKTSKKSKAAKAAGKKATRKKTAAKTATKKKAKKATKKKAKKAAKKGVLGCCTLRGSGPDSQIEGITREECRRRAIKLNKNFSWVAGKCAEPF